MTDLVVYVPPAPPPARRVTAWPVLAVLALQLILVGVALGWGLAR